MAIGKANKATMMTEGVIWKQLIAFAVPLLLGNLLQQLYNTVDSIVVGQFIGSEALAAVSSSNSLINLIIGMFLGISTGAGVILSQYYGARNEEKMQQAVHTSIGLCFIGGLILIVVGILFSPIILEMMGTPEEVMPNSVTYFRIFFAGSLFNLTYNMAAGILRAVGDSKNPLYFLAASSITNIILDIVAVFVLGWGIAGAAAATVFSQLLSGFLCAVKIAATPELRFEKRHLTLSLLMAKDLMGIGIPAAVKNIIIAAGGMVVQTVVNSFDSVSFIAGFTATNKLYGLLEIAALSYGYAVTTYVGQNYGAGMVPRIRSGVRAANTLALLSSVVICAVMLLFGRQITMLFISREDLALALEAGETAYRYLTLMSVSLPILYVLYVFMSALQGMGNTVAPMWSAAFELLIRLTVAFAVAQIGMRNGIFWAEVGAWYGGAATQALGYFLQMRKIKKPSP